VFFPSGPATNHSCAPKLILFHIIILSSVLLCERHSPLVRIVRTTRPTRGVYSFILYVILFIFFFQRRFHTIVVRRFGQVGSFHQNYVKTNHARRASERAAPRFGRLPKSDDDAFLFCISYESKMHSTPACIANKLEFKI